MIKDYAEKEKNKYKDIISLAWYSEVMHRQKRLPKLEKLLKEEKLKKEMTDEDMLSQVKKLNSMLGGEIR